MPKNTNNFTKVTIKEIEQLKANRLKNTSTLAKELSPIFERLEQEYNSSVADEVKKRNQKSGIFFKVADTFIQNTTYRNHQEKLTGITKLKKYVSCSIPNKMDIASFNRHFAKYFEIPQDPRFLSSENLVFIGNNSRVELIFKAVKAVLEVESNNGVELNRLNDDENDQKDGKSSHLENSM